MAAENRIACVKLLRPLMKDPANSSIVAAMDLSRATGNMRPLWCSGRPDRHGFHLEQNARACSAL
eukprot:3302394-Alexandrium_andersonii.AAC.1